MDLKKLAKQHAELDDYFAGFALKGERRLYPHPAQHTDSQQLTSAAAGLVAVAEEVAKCCKCGLAASRTNVVPGEGNPTARLVFVGEGPGADEDAQGRPFVGRAGKLLDKMIVAMGLRREDVFICNVVKCRPPGNRNPAPEEIASCLAYLKRQLAAINPEFVVALGAPAAQTLLETKTPIGQLRGRFHQSRILAPDGPALTVMPTYHPSYLLRNYSDENRRRVWEDLQKVMAEMGL